MIKKFCIMALALLAACSDPKTPPAAPRGLASVGGQAVSQDLFAYYVQKKTGAALVSCRSNGRICC